MDFGLSEKTITGIVNALSHYPSIKEALIFGSRAKGTYRLGSDIDIAIKGDFTHNEMLHLLNEIEDLELPYTVDIIRYNSLSDTDVIGHIDRVGMLIFPRQHAVELYPS